MNLACGFGGPGPFFLEGAPYVLLEAKFFVFLTTRGKKFLDFQPPKANIFGLFSRRRRNLLHLQPPEAKILHISLYIVIWGPGRPEPYGPKGPSVSRT
jgi:hypothetical protein